MSDKRADLAGPGIGTYEEVANVLPSNYESILSPRETMQAWHGVKSYIEETLCKELNLMMVQAATKWKRMALKTFGCDIGEGICTDMKAVRKDYFLDHDHSAYVDQWDWEKAISNDQRNLDYLTRTVKSIWNVLKGAEQFIQDMFPQLAQTAQGYLGGKEHPPAELGAINKDKP